MVCHMPIEDMTILMHHKTVDLGITKFSKKRRPILLVESVGVGCRDSLDDLRLTHHDDA